MEIKNWKFHVIEIKRVTTLDLDLHIRCLNYCVGKMTGCC